MRARGPGVLVLLLLLLALAACGKDAAPPATRAVDAAPAPGPDPRGKVIGTAEGRWLVVQSGGLVYSAGIDAVWGQGRTGDQWKLTMVPGLSADHTFVIDDGAIYWVATPTAGLVGAPLSDGEDARLIADPKAQRVGRVLASDGTTAIWRADGQVIAAPLAGGDIKTLAPSDDDGPLVVADGVVFHAAAGGVARVGLDGSAPGVVAAAQGKLRGLAAKAQRVAWLTADGAVRMAPLAGGEVVELAKGVVDATGLSLGPDGVYVSAGKAILRMPFTPGAAEIVVADAGAPVAPIVDFGSLFWIDTRQKLVYTRPLD